MVRQEPTLVHDEGPVAPFSEKSPASMLQHRRVSLDDQRGLALAEYSARRLKNSQFPTVDVDLDEVWHEAGLRVRIVIETRLVGAVADGGLYRLHQASQGRVQLKVALHDAGAGRLAVERCDAGASESRDHDRVIAVLRADIECGAAWLEDLVEVAVQLDLIQPEIRPRLVREVDVHPQSAPNAQSEPARAGRWQKRPLDKLLHTLLAAR